MRIKKEYPISTIEGGVFNIKSSSQESTYSCDYINQLHNYYTEEHIIGNWIDGRKIYRKVITTSMKCNGALTHGISGLDMFTDIKIIFKQENNNYCILPKAPNGDFTIGIDKFTNSIIQLMCGSYFNNNINYDFVFILEYTKTTD